jgi:molybdenum cofactor synthesis domain-containing protein
MGVITAAALAIGDELLSGRTRDSNVHLLAGWLGERGIALKEARIVADDRAAIIDAVRALSARHDYVFTSGGIGPTHDDITFEAIGEAFGAPVETHPEAFAAIKAWYDARGEETTPARARMALMPRGAALIPNPVSGAPGVRIANVFIMAGVPRIFEGMLHAIDQALQRGVVIHARAATAIGLAESRIADALREIQHAAIGVAIGSYPIDGDQRGVTIIARSENPSAADQAIDRVMAAMRAAGAEPFLGERPGR